MMVAPVSFWVSLAMSTVWSQASWSIMPMPSVEGQISLLTSLASTAGGSAPSCEPAAVTSVGGVLDVVAGVDPALDRGLDELDRLVGVVLVLELVGLRPDRVLEHRGADVVAVDDVEVVGGVELAGVGVDRLQHLGVLVVGHRLGDVDVAGEQAVHVEGLLDEVDVAEVDPVLLHAGEELPLVAVAPAADVLAGEVGRRGDVLRP